MLNKRIFLFFLIISANTDSVDLKDLTRKILLSLLRPLGDQCAITNQVPPTMPTWRPMAIPICPLPLM